MAQTTGGIVIIAEKVEISTNGSSWTDISGFSQSVAQGGGNRAKTDRFTYDGDTPIIGVGKRASLEYTVSVVYTEGVSDAFAVAWDAWKNNTPLYLRYSPKGGTSGQNQFTTTAGKVLSCTQPQAPAESADIVLSEFVLACADVTKAVI